MKKYTGMTNGKIGQIFNGLTFSAVAKVYHRMSKAVEENRTLRKKWAKLFLLCPNSRADPVPFM